MSQNDLNNLNKEIKNDSPFLDNPFKKKELSQNKSALYTALDDIENKEYSSEKVAVATPSSKETSDPYRDFTSFNAAPGYSVLPNDKETERIRTENIRAKEREIAAPGNFTREEADLIKVGLDPAKQAEVEAQVLETSPEDRNKLFDEIQVKISEFVNNPNFGRNEVRAQLHSIRLHVQELEQRMDRGLI